VDVRERLALALTLVLAGCAGGTQNAPSPQLSAAATVVKDSALLAAVKAKLIATDPDSATSLGVAVHDGVVTLRGTVLSAAARTRDVQDAKSVPGVRSVVDRLQVNPNAPRPKEQLSDFALAERIKAALAAQVGFTRIGVHVTRGVATLDGTAPDAKTKETAVATARGTSGIRNVVDRIVVQRP
jgi:osmotically-inducible protein OsmY